VTDPHGSAVTPTLRTEPRRPKHRAGRVVEAEYSLIRCGTAFSLPICSCPVMNCETVRGPWGECGATLISRLIAPVAHQCDASHRAPRCQCSTLRKPLAAQTASVGAMTTTLAAVEDADPFLAIEATRLLDLGYRITASRREDYGGRYEIILALAGVEVARGDGEDVAEALSHAIIVAGL